jgi:hypothetical protein
MQSLISLTSCDPLLKFKTTTVYEVIPHDE